MGPEFKKRSVLRSAPSSGEWTTILKKPRLALVGSAPITPITTKERQEIDMRVKEECEQLRKVYPEVHGKVADFITHTVTDRTLHVSVRFIEARTFAFAMPPASS